MNFKKISYKLLIFLFLISTFIIPKNAFAYTNKLIVGGENIGIEVNSSGVLVVGFYNIDGNSPGRDSNLRIGDRIVKIDDTVIDGITDLTKATNTNSNNIKITYIRNNKEYSTNLTLYKDSNNVFKTGLYVKDVIVGIGTLTFIEPNSMSFGALGHEIVEKSTNQKFEIKTGTIFESNITSVSKATRTTPGEKNASYNINNNFGVINKNEITGIYGKYTKEIDNKNLMEIATSDEIKIGKATIKTVIENNKIEEFEIEILQIFKDNEVKNILFKVIDNKLLSITGGIIQGMSGSPIIQNNKIIGAVTHVLSDDATKGFGIFIETMLKEIEN